MKSSPKKTLTTDEKFDHLTGLVEGLIVNVKDLTQKVGDVTQNLASLTQKVDGLSQNVDSLNQNLDNLAIITANGFARVDTEFSNVKADISGLDERLVIVEEVVKNTRQDVLNIGDKFVSRTEFDNHIIQFSRLDKKVNELA